MAVVTPRPAAARRWPAWLPLAAIILGLTLLALPVLTYPLGRDQGEFATIGRGILDGRVPYVDLWNPKPPAVFYVYAAAMRLFGQTSEALRALDLLVAPLVALGLYWLGARLANRVIGCWAALLFLVFYFTETFWTLTQNDGIALLPMVWALVCALKAADGGRRAALWAFAAGTLCAWVMWFKYPFALFVGVVVVALRMGRRTGLPIIAFLAGALLVGAGGLVHMASLGALDALIESATVTSQYTALGFNLDDLSAALRLYLGYRWAHWGILFLLAALWWPLRRLLREGDNGRGWGIVWLWLLAATAIMLVQAKGYDYHWLPMLPPLALLAGDSLERAISGLAQRFGGAATLRAAAGVVLVGILVLGVWPRALPYLTGQQDRATYYSRFQAGEFVADESLRVAEYLRARVAPGDSLFIWGFRPEVYYLSALNPATRFIFQFPLVGTWYPPAWKKEAVDVLWAALPPYTLVLQGDYMPWVTGRNEDSNQLLQEYTELNNWLMANYTPETQIGTFLIWRRNS